MTAFTPTVFDHLLFALLAILLPVGGWVSMRRIRRQVESGVPHTTRVADYRNNIIVMWGVAGLAAILWLALNRDWAELGVAAVGGSAIAVGAGLLLAGGLIAIDLYYFFRVQRSDIAARELVRKTAAFDMVLPHTRQELQWFYGLSFTAGITEEILYRGFLITYFAAFLTLPLAVLVSSAVFAVAHLYQGAKGASRTFVIGLTLATAYVLTGSILFSVIAHILVDAISGRMIYSAFNRMPPTAAAQETC